MNYDQHKAKEHTLRCVASLRLWDCEIKQLVVMPMPCLADVLVLIIVEANIEVTRKRPL